MFYWFHYTIVMTENQPKKVNKKKTRGYALVIYPESLPKDYIERINNLHMQCLLSPLHDKDMDGEKPKKATLSSHDFVWWPTNWKKS